MKLFLISILLLAINLPVNAATFSIEDLGKNKFIKIQDDSLGVGQDIFLAIANFLRDPLDGYKLDYRGNDFQISEYIIDPTSMDGQGYKINFLIDPVAQNLKIDQSKGRVIMTFEGNLASIIFRGLYIQRMGIEKYFPMNSGKYYGDFSIRNINHSIECKYATRVQKESTLTEKYAECTIQIL